MANVGAASFRQFVAIGGLPEPMREDVHHLLNEIDAVGNAAPVSQHFRA